MTTKAVQQRSQPIESNTTEEQQNLHTREHHTAKAMQEKPPHSKNHTEQHTTKAAQQRTAHSKVIQWGTPHRKSHTIENTSFFTHSKSCTREGGSTQ